MVVALKSVDVEATTRLDKSPLFLIFSLAFFFFKGNFVTPYIIRIQKNKKS